MSSTRSITRILEVSASGRRAGSVSRRLTQELLRALEARHGEVDIVHRDLGEGMPFVDEDWIAATFTPASERTREHERALAFSDELVAELSNADILVIGAPMYNFGPPAVLKAWIDMVARAGLTFRYTENGPVGLVRGVKAYIVTASGGVPAGSEADFLTPYLEHALGFLGVDDVDVIAADRLNARADQSVDAARARIADLVPVCVDEARRVA